MQTALLDEIPRLSGMVAGVDEAGRGPLAGNVVAAAVILDPARPIDGINDSKQLSASRREQLAIAIREQALACAVASVGPAEIDQLNILWASMKAMRLAVEQLALAPEHALIDGNRCPPGLVCAATAIIKGDARVAAIGAASILAKVERDRQMQELHQLYPEYGFDSHKGYPTRAHFAALEKYGACPQHRRSFAPVRRALGVAQAG